MATKTFNHQVIYNGDLYPANTPIPVDTAENEGTKKDGQAKKGGVKNEHDKGAGPKS